MKLILFLLFPLLIFADVKYEFVRYVGDGSAQDTITASTIDTISMVIIINFDATDFVYIRTASVDSITGTEPKTSSTKDSLCWKFPHNDVMTTKTGILRWDGNDVIIGSSITTTSNNFGMWVFSDPTEEVLVTGYWKGDGTTPHQEVSTGYGSSFEALFTFASDYIGISEGAIWGQSGFRFIGDRGSDDISNNDPGLFYARQATFRKMNQSNEWYIFFGLKENTTYCRIFDYVGDAGANDTLLHSPATSFTSFFMFAQPWPAGSIVSSGIVHGGTSMADTTFELLLASGCTVDEGAQADIVKEMVDSLIIKGGGVLDLVGVTSKFVFFGEATGGITPPPVAGQGRPPFPCEGNTQKTQKGNTTWQKRY
jgi:hypothetical protein